jgi:hypothetical protein
MYYSRSIPINNSDMKKNEIQTHKAIKPTPLKKTMAFR